MNQQAIIGFLQQITDEKEATMVFEKISQLLDGYSLAKKLQFEQQDMWIIGPFGRLNLESHSRICRLFSFFIEKNRQEATKEELLSFVYREEMQPCPSDRRLECLERNLVKVISRGRILASQTFVTAPRNISWFPYHPIKKTWSFFAIFEETQIELAA